MEKVEKNLTFGELWQLYLVPNALVKIYVGLDYTNSVHFANVEDMTIHKYFKLEDLVVKEIYPHWSGQTGSYLVIELEGDDSND